MRKKIIKDEDAFRKAIDFVGRQTKRDFTIRIDAEDFSLALGKWTDPWVALTSCLFTWKDGFESFWYGLSPSNKGNWSEYLPIWMQQFLEDVELVYCYELESQFLTKGK
jgi:hypothetical protein